MFLAETPPPPTPPPARSTTRPRMAPRKLSPHHGAPTLATPPAAPARSGCLSSPRQGRCPRLGTSQPGSAVWLSLKCLPAGGLWLVAARSRPGPPHHDGPQPSHLRRTTL